MGQGPRRVRGARVGLGVEASDAAVCGVQPPDDGVEAEELRVHDEGEVQLVAAAV